MMPGFGGGVGGMNPLKGGGFGLGTGGIGNHFNMYPGWQMGYSSPFKGPMNSDWFGMMNKAMKGQPLMKHHHLRKKHKDYLDPRTSAFGKMGFPSISGNMMGLVNTAKHMPNFMKMPPQIHITADFRRLLGDDVK